MDDLHCTDVYETHNSQQRSMMSVSTTFGQNAEEMLEVQTDIYLRSQMFKKINLLRQIL
jgi:hypothetical protein